MIVDQTFPVNMFWFSGLGQNWQFLEIVVN
jgi:hypothetical protein